MCVTQMKNKSPQDMFKAIYKESKNKSLPTTSTQNCVGPFALLVIFLLFWPKKYRIREAI